MDNPLIYANIRRIDAKILLVLISFVLVLISGLPAVAQGAGASLYLAPSSGSFLNGSTFTISIFLNTEGNEINLVWADLKFPPEILQVTSPIADTSFISEWIVPPNYSNERGMISFKGGIPGGISTSAGLVSSITFRAVAPGTAKIEFSEESKILLNDGKGTDILTNSRGGGYRILVPPPEGPEVFSPTHPNPNVWYPDSSSAFSWEKKEGETDFSWSFDQNPQGRPDGISEGDETQVSFSEVKDGIWYFHIRQKKDGIWGKTTDVPVRIDTTPPNDFSPRIETYSRFVVYQAMVYFETGDNFSGVDHYKISTIDLSISPPTQSFFREVTSPYKLSFEEEDVGEYIAIVRAVDKAGNIREKETRFQVITPFVIHIEEKGLYIKGVLFPWPLFFLGLILLFAVSGYLLFLLIKPKTGFNKGLKEIEEALAEIKKIEDREKRFKEKKDEFEKEKEKLDEKLSSRNRRET